MSYTPTNWNTGDTITASALNKIENGIANAGGGAEIVNLENVGGTYTLDKTFAEIYDYLHNGVPCFVKYSLDPDQTLDTSYTYHQDLAPITMVFKYDDAYRIIALRPSMATVGNENVGVPSTLTFQASVSTDNPTFLRRAVVGNSAMTVLNNMLP